MNAQYRPLPRGARVIEQGKIRFPSVTTILSGVDPIRFPEYLLRQYASRGSISHALGRHFLTTGKWELDPLKTARTPEERIRLLEDMEIVARGNLKLRWQDCNFPGFLEKYGRDFKPWPGKTPEERFFDQDFRFTGAPDWPCLYKDEPAIADLKTSGFYPVERVLRFMKQLAAYARIAAGEIKYIITIPLNPRNKCGFGEPIISTNVDGYFNMFVRDRWMFLRLFGL